MSKRKDYTHIFERIAAKNHTTVAEVRRNMEATIQVGFSDSDPQIRAACDKIPCKGELPTPDELLAYVAWQAKKEKADVLLRRYFKL
ncbi:MAG: hypothetical protein Q4B48_07160 [Syntrophomonadaceae bacterium]|nr:hypothetical protein [Syntrophomonadaceae bacterium]